jgi:prevent-host-death family protein
MQVYTFTDARQNLAEVLELARKEDVLIKRRNGETFVLSYRRPTKSVFDLPPTSLNLDGEIKSSEIVDAIQDSRFRALRD